MPSDLMFKTLNATHQLVLKLSGGKAGWRVRGFPVVELTTTGRRSGQPRTVLLPSPYQEGETIVVVGSRGGDDRDPAWVFNLREHSAVEVAFAGGPRRPMVAHVADEAERARLWPIVTGKSPNYAQYQTRTEREIPLVLLDPA